MYQAKSSLGKCPITVEVRLFYLEKEGMQNNSLFLFAWFINSWSIWGHDALML